MTRPRWLHIRSLVVTLAACGAAILGFALFMVLVGWPSLIRAAFIEANARAERAAESRYAARVMLEISALDVNCLQWDERGTKGSGRWVCVKR